ncbi:MAG: filamentous hemagglutinin N-terminal domain-containing protein, partial [Deltaproteobacteria bacterium]|nr:filamentous hemagglutinin N-terminal domain-containing protein [Deltaproteobacteria bacterium]
MAAIVVLIPERVPANPKGEQVIAGSVKFDRSGGALNIITSERVIINWDQFNIAPQETTRFIQPGSNSFALNRILDNNPSTIFGSLQANGNVVLLNGAGIIFGPNSKVNVHGLIATSLSIEDQDFLNGKFKFIGHDQNGAVKNFGNIETVTGGFAYLLAPNVENSGIIRSPEGHIALAAGTKAYLSNRPDGTGLLIEVQAPAGQAINLKDLVSDGGRVDLYGRAVNQSGLVQANTVEDREGEIRLVASNRVYFEEGSDTSARGADAGLSRGGSVTAISGGGTGGGEPSADLVFKKDAVIDVSGGAGGGDGGTVELSASGGMALEGAVRGEAAEGYAGGELLIDPANVTIGNSAPNGSPVVDPPGTGTVNFDSPALPSNLTLNANSSFTGLSIIRVEATNNISIVTAWNLQPQVEELTLRAGNDIIFGTGAQISDLTSGPGFNLNLVAGADFASGGLFDVQPGVGNLTNALVEIGDGRIKAVTGNSINLQDGAIRTTKGGSIDLTAVQGNINAGRNAAFLERAGSIALRLPTGGVGGIGTQAGGDIVLNAPNGEISSSFTHIGAYSFPAGTMGNLTMNARDFSGHFLVNRGHADVHLTGSFGVGVRTTTIDLANGSTAYVEAANVRLGQIRNPQGALGLSHFFNYGNAGVELVATSGDVVLVGDAGAGNTDGINVNRILAPNLTARALQGDILIGNDFVLFPSSTGNLIMEAFGDITNNFAVKDPVRTDSLPPDPFASAFNSAPTMAEATGNSGINSVFPV